MQLEPQWEMEGKWEKDPCGIQPSSLQGPLPGQGTSCLPKEWDFCPAFVKFSSFYFNSVFGHKSVKF